MNKVELLAPAGSLEKLKMAVIYGADAVYIGGEEYSLRAYADNFDRQDMREGIKFAHLHGKKVYVTLNIIPHNEDLKAMPAYVKEIEELGADAVILSDPGVYSLVKENAAGMEIHLSTQANNTNWKSAEFWYRHGIKRVILARELSLKEIGEIRENTPEGLELEIFVHGAMCISYSGRCLLSNYMAGRDSNRGLCAHPCRWKYYLMEEKRPGEYMSVYENERGTFIYNSKDLCMIEYIPQIIESGVSSLKIEGRMKSSFYVATVVKAYREAIDAYYDNPGNYRFNRNWLEEISKASHREYTTGFYLGKPTGEDQIYHTSSYIREYDFIGLVKAYDEATGIAEVEQRNRMFCGEEMEVVRPKGPFYVQKIKWMKNAENEDIRVAPHPQMTVYMPMDRPVEEYTMLRRKADEKEKG
ncbi:MAG: U32 family peptidase [Clostridiales bacterium]|jgi:putative protease|nr:U32 family peptidase [Eubacteriales bacterium]MDH7564888.1 U32 family peptidase [Clostridiales bacterium]